MTADLININSRIEMKEKHAGREQWKNFSSRCTRNPFLKEYLLDEYNHRCSYCGRPIRTERFCLHHLDYDHECLDVETIRIPHPTPKRPDKTYAVPDCEMCMLTCRRDFEECISRLRPVHISCNVKIEESRKEREGY